VLHIFIEQRLKQVIAELLPDANLETVLVRPCPDAKFGDYQSNALMALAKERKLNPRQLATQVIGKLDVKPWCDSVEIAGAGFLNFRISAVALARTIAEAAAGKHLFIQPAEKPRVAVVDFSSPNVAKPMHVGHIRSTILGDSLARALRLLGHRVITDNHIGDWGTQFGKLLLGWKQDLDRAALEKDPIGEMERMYKKINAACDADAALYETAKQELAKLQAGDPENLAIWRQMIALSQVQFDTIYQRLGVHFDQTLGESFYNGQLKDVVRQFVEAGLARPDEGAIRIFFDDVPELKEHPAVIQKADGAATYTTTDLATLAYRLETWQPDEIIYVTDGRQQLHFKEIFTSFKRWKPAAKVKLAHVWFGSILGDDGKPFKTRSGDTVKLADLLDEAEERAFKTVSDKNPGLSEAERKEIARIVGIGAVKYADLLPNRQSDYVFSWDKMLAFNGNTAPYLLYAYTRTRGIFRKVTAAEIASMAQLPDDFVLRAPEEIALAKHLLNFGLVVQAVADDCRPNYLCNYLYDLAGHFARFYENCPVLKEVEGTERTVRLALCDLAGRVLQQGLRVLGIETTEHM
jgi:arginyl-tRNA synthetase